MSAFGAGEAGVAELTGIGYAEIVTMHGRMGSWRVVRLFLIAFFLLGCGKDEPTGPPSQSELPLCVNEFMASNHAADTDEFGEFDDWFEIFNPGADAIDIGGMYVTDDFAELKRYRIPTSDPVVTTIPAHGFLVIWADRQPEQGLLHANFALSASGEAIVLVEANGVSVIDQIEYGPQVEDVSYGRLPDGANVWRPFTVPTRGDSNVVASEL